MYRPEHPLGPRGRPHAVRRADEQLVLQHMTQAREGMANGGLG